ncbi:hypothetical protein BC830DRAFT_1216822 [Chytriomyces sp. MP71]|nr:hypothetical protein BC830DRAFT_1216822 [Chytriomyces sp. MP71]
MPSLTEWTSVYSFFYDTSTEAQSSLPHFIIDKKRFLNTFFAQPTALWLIMTAFALRHISSDVLALSYFDRAKLEATQETEAPSFKTIQTLFLISNYATGIKDKATSHLFMELTLDLLARLRLSCEQDESVQSDEDTTIEGFRTVSRIFYTVKCEIFVFRAISSRSDSPSGTESCNLGIQKARLPRPLLMLPDIGTNYQTVLSYFNSASFLAIISSAKRHHCSEPPALVHDLLFSPAIRSLTTRLNAIQDSLRGSLLFQPLPHNFQTHGTLSHSILSQQIHFMSHLSNRGCMEQSASVELSCASNAAVCVALRPALYLTGFLHQDSPLLHHVPTRKSLQAALEKCLAASSCIADLASFLIAATRLDSSSSTPGAFHVSATLWEILPNFKFALFEAAVTLWFLACRTKAVFFPVTHSKAVFKDKVVASLMDVLLALSILGATPDLSLDLPAFSPLERCVQAMLCEVQGSALSYCPKSALDTDPSCYLGLLGVQLDCDSVEWNSAWETKWADFWKKAGDNSYLIHKD